MESGDDTPLESLSTSSISGLNSSMFMSFGIGSEETSRLMSGNESLVEMSLAVDRPAVNIGEIEVWLLCTYSEGLLISKFNSEFYKSEEVI